MSDPLIEVPNSLGDTSAVQIQSLAESLTITMPSIQGARTKIHRNFLFVNLLLIGGTLVLVLPLLMDYDFSGQLSGWGILAFMLVLVNGFWYSLKYQNFQRVKGSGRLSLNPYLFQMDEWFLPTHLIDKVEYAPHHFSEYEGLHIFWSDDTGVRSQILQLFLKSEDYRLIAAAFNTYLAEHAQAIEDAVGADFQLALPQLIPTVQGVFPITFQEQLPMIRPALQWPLIALNLFFFLVMVSAYVVLIPAGISNLDLIQDLLGIDFKDLLSSIVSLVELGFIIVMGLVFICLPFLLLWKIKKAFVRTRLELHSESLTVHTGKSLLNFPWQEVQGFKLLETISGTSENRTITHRLMVLHQDHEHTLIERINDSDCVKELAWLKDIFERAWRQARVS